MRIIVACSRNAIGNEVYIIHVVSFDGQLLWSQVNMGPLVWILSYVKFSHSRRLEFVFEFLNIINIASSLQFRVNLLEGIH